MTAQIQEYLDDAGRSPFEKWFTRLDGKAANHVTIAIYRLGQGNNSISKSIGDGVHELRIHYGPGLRVYYGWDGQNLVILLGGGTKKTQSTDIRQAKSLWVKYKRRKKL
ncbi:MAG: type II toxin-antitoxin system RelE/ParE family toxin [Magnetococcus sp. DMHC-1]|nr:type II toxin-antitoxin system RelE/ParE family toxin [Magnetococcales bacterium]MBF0154840.1 type II toxin-antitoxin system RelE/ParE family toxin [Magnetococcales bacterium]